MPESTRFSDMSLDLGDDKIVLKRVEAMEGLSTPFTIVADIFSPLEIDLLPHMGKPCGLTINGDDGVQRYFHGLVVSSEYSGEQGDGHSYRLTLKPWTYFLSQNRNMAIFQDQSAVDIIKQILAENGISSVRFALSLARLKRVYCVQYRESDFAFISRLMEEEGIYYFFEHEAAQHVMVFADSPGAHFPGSPDKLVYNPNSVSVFNSDSKARSSSRNYLQNWGERISTTGEAKVTLRDYSFKTPDAPLKAEAQGEGGHAHDSIEVFDYPGRFEAEMESPESQETAGRQMAKARLDGMRAQRRILNGTSQSAGLCCGNTVSVEQHPTPRMNGDFLITSTYHSIAAETYRSGRKEREAEYNVRFEAIGATTPFQPPHVTPRPVVMGLETAVVTGKDGEEIYTDEYGRVKVRFFWDRSGKDGDKTTCWIRVSQTGGLGNLILPRLGHEVLVDFLGGDPDRPVVVGRVFNQNHMPIYPLPDNKTKALWRTKSVGPPGSYPQTKSLDTKEPRANEIRFEDKGGEEELFIHAERDMNTRVRFDETHHVGHNQTLMIGYDREEEVVHDETVVIGNDRKANVKKNETLKVDQNQTVSVGQKRDTKIGTDDIINVTQSSKLTANKSVEITVGASSIKIEPTQITIKSPMIKIQADAMADLKSPLTTVNGDGMLTLKGGITMIN